MDDADLAQRKEAMHREVSIRQVSMALAGDGADQCEDCDDLIAEARRRAVPSARKCITCQEAAERRNRARA